MIYRVTSVHCNAIYNTILGNPVNRRLESSGYSRGVKFLNIKGECLLEVIRMQILLGRKKVIGRHVYGELYDCDPRLLGDEVYLVKVIEKAAEVGEFTLLDVKAWKISPGVSVIGIVLESHISIHTWPEYKFASVDVYTCGLKGDPFKAFEYITKALKAGNYSMKYISRDYEENG